MATSISPSVAKPDWDALAKSLDLDSPEEAQSRAFEIAQFVAKVEQSGDQKLVLKSGGQYIELSLKR